LSTVESCGRCGRVLTGGSCPHCPPDPSVRVIHREFILLSVLIGIAIGGFLLTRNLAVHIQNLRAADATEWFDRGHHELDAGSLAAATADLRRATAMDPVNVSYQVALARALSGDARDAEARQILVALREHQPEDPDTNLQLARLEARTGQTDAAIRYYQGALAALWSPDDAEARQRTRIELITYLLGHQRRGRALSELLLMNTDLPPDEDTQIAVGRMFLEAGDPRRAADHFGEVLRQAPTNGAALAGAGAAAFAMGQYQQALHYLTAAPDSVPGVTDTRTVARLVLDRDPLTPRLGTAERSRRLAASVADLIGEIDGCAALHGGNVDTPADTTLRALRVQLTAFAAASRGARPARRTVTRDALEDGLDLLLRAVRARADAGCPQTAGLDRALELIAGRHALEGS
jgi:tetratricopeptide (TPR) repeat protein